MTEDTDQTSSEQAPRNMWDDLVASRGRADAILVAINCVMSEISKSGIGKTHWNKQGFWYRGIDDLYDILGPLFAKYQIILLSESQKATYAERVAASGNILSVCRIKCRWRLESAIDGSYRVISGLGEGMDSGDKATAKAQAMAFKYAFLQAFVVPLSPQEAQNIDSDGAETDEILPRVSEAQASTIKTIAKEVGVPIERVCEVMQVTAVENIPEKQFGAVIASLKKKVEA